MQSNAAEISAFGTTFKFMGPQGLLVGLLVLMIVGVAMFASTLKEGQKELLREMRVQSYLLSMPPSDRPKLMVPPELRGRMQP